MKKELISDKEILEIIEKTLDEGKAEDVAVIDLRGKTSIANEMVVASGTSDRHVIAMAQKIIQNLKNAGCTCSSEGMEKGDWVLIDAFDVIVHIFRPEVRGFYNLEKMWNSIANLRSED